MSVKNAKKVNVLIIRVDGKRGINMADIELVIKISEEKYKWIKENILRTNKNSIVKAIANGTPLPKGHGKLKDFDKIEWYGCDLEGRGCIEAKGDCSVCNHASCHAKQVRELPTIIEKDKEQEDGNDIHNR